MKTNAMTEWLRAQRIFNDHLLLATFAAEGRDIAVSFRRTEYRDPAPSGAYVSSPSHHTDPKAHWLQYGCKVFRGRRSETMPKAMTWAENVYGIEKWAPSPFTRGGKVPAEVIEAVKKAMKENA